ncbi:MAG: hypothetical protein AB7G93_12915 [Bdellovibrionales bacterium]
MKKYFISTALIAVFSFGSVSPTASAEVLDIVPLEEVTCIARVSIENSNDLMTRYPKQAEACGEIAVGRIDTEGVKGYFLLLVDDPQVCSGGDFAVLRCGLIKEIRKN